MTIYEDNVATLIISVKCSILHLNLLFCFFAGFTWTWTRTWTWVYLNPNLNLGTWYLSPIYRWRKNEKYEVWVHLNARFFTWTWRPVPGLAERPCPAWAPASETSFTSEKRQLDGVPTVVIQWERKTEEGVLLTRGWVSSSANDLMRFFLACVVTGQCGIFHVHVYHQQAPLPIRLFLAWS